MANGVWKGVYPYFFGLSHPLSFNKHSFYEKVDDGEKKKKRKRKEKRMMFLVATTSLPAVYRPNGYARPATPERRPLERRTLVPKECS